MIDLYRFDLETGIGTSKGTMDIIGPYARVNNPYVLVETIDLENNFHSNLNLRSFAGYKGEWEVCMPVFLVPSRSERHAHHMHQSRIQP